MRYLILSLAFSAVTGLSAQSLVPNGSFETYSSCPSGPMQINLATGWYSACQTPDYFHTCGASMVGVPSNWCGVQSARTGNAYGRVLDYGYAANYREYMQIQLSSAMVAGTTYTVSYYVNLNDNASIAHNGPEAYFSSTAISTTTLFTYTPHISHPSIITDKSGWVLITGTYTAAGGERYMTLGQYGNDASVATSSVAGGIWASASYYIEDVSVTATVLSAGTADLTAIPLSLTNSLSVSLAVPSSGRLTVQRSTDGEVWTDLAETAMGDETHYSFQDANPATRTWYRARIEDAAGDVSHTEVREVLRNTDATTLLVYPNPVRRGETYTIALPQAEWPSDLKVFDLRGTLLMEASAQSTEWVLTAPLSPGVYLIQVQTDSGKRFTGRLTVY